MDFIIPAKALSLLSPGIKPNNPELSLKIGQQLDAKILNISVERNIIELQLNKAIVKVTADPPLTSQPPLTQSLPPFTKGEQISLLVSKLLPRPELTLELTAVPSQKQSQFPLTGENKTINQAGNGFKSNPAALKLLFTTTIQPQIVKNSTDGQLSLLEKGQPFTAKIISIENSSLKLELMSAPKNNRFGVTQSIKTTVLSVPLEKISQPQTSLFKTDLSQLKTGQLISLEITKTGNHPEFKILKNQPPPPLVTPEKILTETIRRFLPVQQSPFIFIEQLGENIPSLIADKTIPDTLKQLAQQILQQLPKKITLTHPQGLKKSINNSGLFLESRLFQSEQDPLLKNQTDFKAVTLKFIQALKQQLPITLASEFQSTENKSLDLKQLQNNAESSIAKIVLDQISSLPKEDMPKQILHLELPYLGDQKNVENITIQIEQDNNNQAQTEKDNWTVDITLNPPRLGELFCKISCINGTISTYFWSNSSKTNNLVNQNLDFLKSRLEASGLKTGQIKAHDHAPKSAKKGIECSHKLIDEQI